MQKFYEVAGEVMGFFDAFKGSRPAINNEKILIVRGRSRKTLDVNPRLTVSSIFYQSFT